MTGTRGLLRLDDKVAAEGRRLEHIGGPPLTHLVPILVVTAIVLHAVVLLMPALRTGGGLPAASPAPDFPLVWRSTPVVQRVVPSPPRAVPPRHSASPKHSRAAPLAPRPLSVEPVPEPAPEVAATSVGGEIEPFIPPPDAPPASAEPGAPQAPASTSQDAPRLTHQVPPVYPVLAKSLRAEARVTLRLAVLPDGSVQEAAVLGTTRPGMGFEAAALQAVKRWRYEPVSTPAPLRTTIVNVEFKLQEQRP